jgi:hypothetical protein
LRAAEISEDLHPSFSAASLRMIGRHLSLTHRGTQ